MIRYIACAASSVVLFSAASAQAVITASEVVGYTRGEPLSTYWGVPYSQSAAALGLPNPTQSIEEVISGGVTEVYGDDSVITPFNASYNPEHVVGIGAGGSLTLKLAQPVAATGATIAVHTAVGLNWNFGTDRAGLGAYTDPRIADVRVSTDNVSWVSLGEVNFDDPTNYYADSTEPFPWVAGSSPADVLKHYDADPNAFVGLTFDQVLDVFDGSAGGTWLDLAGTGLANVRYIEFSLPESSMDRLYIDSVVGVPEPAALIAAAPLLLLRRRRRRD